MGIEMHTTALSQVIAKKVFLKTAQVPKELQKSKTSVSQPDSVNISSDASKVLKSTENLTEFEKDRALNVERIKNQVNNGSYTMNDQVIEEIAEKIASMFF